MLSLEQVGVKEFHFFFLFRFLVCWRVEEELLNYLSASSSTSHFLRMKQTFINTWFGISSSSGMAWNSCLVGFFPGRDDERKNLLTLCPRHGSFKLNATIMNSRTARATGGVITFSAVTEFRSHHSVGRRRFRWRLAVSHLKALLSFLESRLSYPSRLPSLRIEHETGWWRAGRP